MISYIIVLITAILTGLFLGIGFTTSLILPFLNDALFIGETSNHVEDHFDQTIQIISESKRIL